MTAGVVRLNPRPRFRRGDHVELAESLLADLNAEAPHVNTDGRWCGYQEDRGIFVHVEPSRLSATVQSYAGQKVAKGEDKEPRPLRLNASDVHGTLRLAADLASVPDFFTHAPRGVVFADGFVEVTPTGIVRKGHSPDHRARFAYPFPYDGKAFPFEFWKFLRSVFANDDDDECAAKICLLQEYIGVALLGLATKYQKALVFEGDGANGKGVCSSIMERCMPPGSVCAIPPQDLGQEYRRAMLAGKLLNIVSELPEADILDSESWKAIVAGDTTTGREIRKEPFTFKPVAGHVYSANRLPGTTDQTHGFWRRLLVLRFGRVFAEHEQDPTLADRIVEAERPAIVAWALDGAQRVLATGRYTVPPSSAEAVESWQRASDQVRAFVEERCDRLAMDVSPGLGEAAGDLYRAYRGWATDNGHRPMASNKFGERMRLLGLEAHRGAKGARTYPVTLRSAWVTG
jgi:P4 family phage/plasmid primase-like protien